MTHLLPAPQPPRRFPRQALALAALAGLGMAAQTDARADEAGTAQTPTLDTITVTATRRAQSLQSVPVAVSVIDGEPLAQSNRNTLGALATQVPSVNFRTGASNKDTSLFVRGVGTISTSPGVEPTVSTVIDGVVLARPGQATLDLLDVDRVEVLRGAQGTLFGKNASAGVINISTRTPAHSPEAYIDLAHYGGGHENRARAGLSGELSAGLTGSLTALRAHYDGNVRNVFTGEDVNGYDKKGLRGRLDWDLGASGKLSFNADWLQSHDTIPTGVITRTALIAYPSGSVSTYPAFAAALAPVTASADNRQINANLKTTAADRNRGASVQWELPLGGHTLTAITAWRDWRNQQVQDGDRLGAPAVGLPQSHDHGGLDFDQFSQELRLASDTGGAFDYVGGLYYMHTRDRETYRRDVLRVLADGSPYADWGLAHYGTQSDSTAAFGEGRWHFAPDTRALLGLRVTQDGLSFEHQRSRSTPDAQFNGAIPGVNAAVANEGSTRETGYSGRAGLQHDLSAQASSYLTFSRGYKGPAYNVFFNMLDRDTLALKPETSNSLEAGLKTETFEHRLRVNLAAFLTKYSNYQANFYDNVDGTVITRLINAGEVSSRGVELDLSAKPTPRLTLGAAAAYIRARIDDFNCPAGAAASCEVNGKPLPFSPDWKLALRGEYTLPLDGGLQLTLGSDWNWQSKVQYDIGQYADTVQAGYGIWNANLALASPAQGWRVAVLAKNLGDRSYASFLGRGGSYVNRWVPRDDQRYFGINVRHDFL